MKTVRDACQLQPNALSIKLSDQVEQLDELIDAEGDGTAFFDKTHITQGMQDLITEGIARLAGVSSQAVFHLKQAMGGGKTHLLVGFGLLASEGSELHQSTVRSVLYAIMELVNNVDGNEVIAHLTLNVPDYYSNQTQRERVVEVADYLAKKLEPFRPEEASAARVLRELVKNQRLG